MGKLIDENGLDVALNRVKRYVDDTHNTPVDRAEVANDVDWERHTNFSSFRNVLASSGNKKKTITRIYDGRSFVMNNQFHIDSKIETDWGTITEDHYITVNPGNDVILWKIPIDFRTWGNYSFCIQKIMSSNEARVYYNNSEYDKVYIENQWNSTTYIDTSDGFWLEIVPDPDQIEIFYLCVVDTDIMFGYNENVGFWYDYNFYDTPKNVLHNTHISSICFDGDCIDVNLDLYSPSDQWQNNQFYTYYTKHSLNGIDWIKVDDVTWKADSDLFSNYWGIKLCNKTLCAGTAWYRSDFEKTILYIRHGILYFKSESLDPNEFLADAEAIFSTGDKFIVDKEFNFPLFWSNLSVTASYEYSYTCIDYTEEICSPTTRQNIKDIGELKKDIKELKEDIDVLDPENVKVLENRINEIEQLLPEWESPTVDLGLPSGLLWADRNVGAESPEDPGLYFQWGDTVGYTAEQVANGEKSFSSNWSDYFDNIAGSNEFNKYSTEKLIVLEASDDAASVNMGSDCRMPTMTEMQELIDNTIPTFIDIWDNEFSQEEAENGAITEYNLKGVRLTGSNGNSIFIPASGRCGNSTFNDVGYRCYVWSSDLRFGNRWAACVLFAMYNGNLGVNGRDRFEGLPVRAVTTTNKLDVLVSKSEFTKLSEEVSDLSEKVENLPIAEEEVFKAIYGTTTFDEIKAAYDSGKVVHCDYKTYCYVLSRILDVAVYFDAMSAPNSYRITCSADGWAETTYQLELKTNKTTSLSSTSTDTQYPSAKAVYDALQNVGGGESYDDTEIRNSLTKRNVGSIDAYGELDEPNLPNIDLSEYAKKSDLPVVPTQLSAFNNDAGYITKDDVEPYDDSALIRQINAKQDKLVEGDGIKIEGDTISCIHDKTLYKVVSELPQVGEEHKIYLVVSTEQEENNIYNEWAYVNGAWEMLGTYKATIDLEPYVKKEELCTINGLNIYEGGNIEILGMYDYYKKIGGGASEKVFNTMMKYLFTPFMISASGTTNIPDDLLNDAKTNFFTDYYWHYTRLTGGEPVKTTEWKDNVPYKFIGMLSGKYYIIDFTNKTIKPA